MVILFYLDFIQIIVQFFYDWCENLLIWLVNQQPWMTVLPKNTHCQYFYWKRYITQKIVCLHSYKSLQNLCQDCFLIIVVTLFFSLVQMISHHIVLLLAYQLWGFFNYKVFQKMIVYFFQRLYYKLEVRFCADEFKVHALWISVNRSIKVIFLKTNSVSNWETKIG